MFYLYLPQKSIGFVRDLLLYIHYTPLPLLAIANDACLLYTNLHMKRVRLFCLFYFLL